MNKQTPLRGQWAQGSLLKEIELDPDLKGVLGLLLSIRAQIQDQDSDHRALVHHHCAVLSLCRYLGSVLHKSQGGYCPKMRLGGREEARVPPC
jgi:hypothetical protein